MAWQLIYTSAPRLLEAGRSGFGTVARHREIPALLVAAVERISQFSRVPGLDADRVIYAYRQITAGSGRFHVLSCIRDTGADYTGRTNHLAHHLIAEPREIAALGPNGPSPADVLLAFPWLSAWNDPPRWFEATDEFSLAHIPPQTSNDGAWWASVTGNPAHAWLLANGEGSHGATLLAPPGCNLRALFAESLRLTPERLWQVPFTTALQPSDDASDFKWLGLETSTDGITPNAGQPSVLDLTRADSLPRVEVPAVAPIAAQHASPSVHTTTANLPTSRSANIPLTAVTVRKETDDPFAGFEPKRTPLWPWIAAAAVLILAAVGAWALHLALQPSDLDRQQTHAQIDQLRPLDEQQEKKLREAIAQIRKKDQLAEVRSLISAAAQPEANHQLLEGRPSEGLQDALSALRQIVGAKKQRQEESQAKVQKLAQPLPPPPIAPPASAAATPSPSPEKLPVTVASASHTNPVNSLPGSQPGSSDPQTFGLPAGLIFLTVSDASPSRCLIPVLRKNLDYDYSAGAGPSVRLKMIESSGAEPWIGYCLNPNGTIPDFQIDVASTEIRTTSKHQATDFTITASDSGKAVFVWKVRPGGSPPLVKIEPSSPLQRQGLIRSGGAIEFGEALKFLPSRFPQKLALKTPPGFASPEDPGGVKELQAGSLALRPFAEELEQRRGTVAKQIETIERELANDRSPSPFTSEQKKKFDSITGTVTSAKGKNAMTSGEKPASTQCGGLLAALGEEWGSDLLGNAGLALAKAETPTDVAAALAAAKSAVNTRLGDLAGSTQKVQKVEQPPLRDFSTLLGEVITARQAESQAVGRRGNLEKQISALKASAAALDAHPIRTTDHMPAGKYQIVVGSENGRWIPVVELEVTRP
jgi:hypothetical protein